MDRVSRKGKRKIVSPEEYYGEIPVYEIEDEESK